jgi:hypothetical protein
LLIQFYISFTLYLWSLAQASRCRSPATRSPWHHAAVTALAPFLSSDVVVHRAPKTQPPPLAACRQPSGLLWIHGRLLWINDQRQRIHDEQHPARLSLQKTWGCHGVCRAQFALRSHEGEGPLPLFLFMYALVSVCISAPSLDFYSSVMFLFLYFCMH